MVESLGFWSAHSLETLKIIAKRAALHNNITVGQSVCNLHEQLFVCLWKNNARLILDRQSLEGSGTDCTCSFAFSMYLRLKRHYISFLHTYIHKYIHQKTLLFATG